MAGFFILLGDTTDENEEDVPAIDTLNRLCKYGVYSTNMSFSDRKQRLKYKISTYADYLSMREGDYVFFFTNRKIYGAGRLTNLGNDCKYWLFDGANIAKPFSDDEILDSKLVDFLHSQNRCGFFFKPATYFPFAIDMDEALTSFPDSFKSLRVIQGRSFIKMDDEEALALFAVLARRNNSKTQNDSPDWDPPAFDDRIHKEVCRKIAGDELKYKFCSESIVSNFSSYNGRWMPEEMAIEAAVVEYLNNNTCEAFDELSYVSHQVSASPAKPVGYMEWMDVFGYSTSKYLTENSVPIQFAIDKYYVMEIKRDLLCMKHNRKKEPKWVGGVKAVANQLMKYVDWIAKNYASGKYQMVKGVLVANDFDDEFIEYCKKMCIRNYNDGYRNSTPSVWDCFELVKYTFDGSKIVFERVYPHS